MHKTFLLGFFALLMMIPQPGKTQTAVVKTNPMKVYMHYMPWFETPETIGRWGWHWTMNTMNPNKIDENGQREIASHYYPLIGPYASRDKDVIEYHLLLMKYSGIDGILIDWYGTVGSNGDVKDLLRNSDSIISYTDDFGLKFGIVLEDRFSRSVNDVKANMAYMRYNYFKRPEYIRTGENENPLVGIFGPITFEDPATWSDIMPAAGEDIEFLTLWYESEEAGNAADGEYSWIYQDEMNHLDHLENFYTQRAPQLKTAMGSAYPGFNDFYAEGGAGSGYFTIPHYYGSTLSETLNKAEEFKNNIDMLQLATFNDFGEGTMFEPTVETGFEYLLRVQDYTGVQYGREELELIYKLFLHRKGYADNQDIQGQLDSASVYLRNLEVQKAADIINSIEITGKHSFKIAGKMKVFPNPVTEGNINIQSDNEQQVIEKVRITDMQGKIVFERRFNERTSGISLPIPDLKSGNYILQVISNKERKTFKVAVSQ